MAAKLNNDEQLAVPAESKEEAHKHDRVANMSWIPLPTSKQVWAHACCSVAALEAALSDDSVTAVTADILMGTLKGKRGEGEELAIAAQPPARTSDLSIEALLKRCLQDRKRHIKLNFKEMAALQACLPVVAKMREALAATRQAIWVNADILPGPGCRNKAVVMPAEDVLAAVKEFCPGINLSLGWTTRIASGEVYSEEECKAMADVCKRQELTPGCSIVFPVAARASCNAEDYLASLLKHVPGSQLLIWTGASEPPLAKDMFYSLFGTFALLGVGDRISFDIQTTDSPLRVLLGTIYLWFLWLCGLLMGS